MKHIYSKARNIFTDGVDLILPPRCPVNGDIVTSQGLISPNVWGELDFIAKPFCVSCGVPLDFVVEEGGKCTLCLDEPPLFKTARSVFKYGGVSRDLILGFKHGDKTHYVASFIPFMAQVGREMLENADYLVPVPLHHLRFISRRYNQAALISGALSKFTNIEHLPLAMKRTRPTPSQGHLNSCDRKKNVRKAFDVNDKYHSLLVGKSIILVDDVYTTGATVNECSRVLLKYGASQVNVLTVARVTL